MQDNLNYDDPYKPKPGDRLYRVPRIRPQRVTLTRTSLRRPIGVSLWSLIYGFAGMILVGALLLMLPGASKSGTWTPFVDCLFTATSSVCVTGLVVVDTFDHWTNLGQAVILVMVQLGGLGFMTITTILLIAAGRRIGLRDRIMISESIGIGRIGGIVRLVRNTALFTLIIEAIGAIVFFLRFSGQFTWPVAVWKSVFQSVSAFNNAGFDLFGGFRSLTGYQTDYLVLLTTASLVILGGVSFLVVENLFRARGLKRTSADTRLVILITTILLGLGTIAALIAEYGNPDTLGALSVQHKILNAFFQSVTARTAGFNTIDTGALTMNALFFIMILMFIGGASGSTAGGIKVNTAGIIIATIWNTIRGRENPGAFGREFQVQQIFRALTLLVISLGLVVVVFLILSATEHFPSINILFETISAFGTVGLSTGITPELSFIGRMAIIVTMFIGRLGPLTLVLILARTQRTSTYRYPKESVRIG
jgi:trk system potassium uptake protein